MGHQATSQETYKLERQLQDERNIVHALHVKHLQLLDYLNEFAQKAIDSIGAESFQQALEDWKECKIWLFEFYTEASQTLSPLMINTHYEQTFFAAGQAGLQHKRQQD